MRPEGILFDYGGTLVEELGYDERAANDWLLNSATKVPRGISLEHVLKRIDDLAIESGSREDGARTEVTWLSLTRLAYDSLGIEFSAPLHELELGYWLKTASTRPMPGAIEALEALKRHGLRMAVLSNCRFSESVLRHELARHGLARHLAFVMVSAEYAARKPSSTLFEAAASRLGIGAKDIWFVGDRIDTDMTGAKAAGMKALWFRTGEYVDAIPRAADHCAASWSEVVEHFDRLMD